MGGCVARVVLGCLLLTAPVARSQAQGPAQAPAAADVVRRVDVSPAALQGAGPVTVVLAAPVLRQWGREELGRILAQRKDLLPDVPWGDARYRNARVVIERVDFEPRPQSNRLGVVATGTVHADREKMVWKNGLRWVADGQRIVSDVRLRGHVRLVADPAQRLSGRPLRMAFHSERVEGRFRLSPVQGTRFGFDHARQLHVERPELVAAADVPQAAGLALTRIEVAGVNAEEVALRGSVRHLP